MKNKLIIVASILVAFVVGFVCANLFGVRLAYSKGQNVQLIFEKTDNDGLPSAINNSKRSKVPGGWIVLVGRSITFVPDPNHQWQ